MPERQPPRVSDDSPIGPDVDLERDDIRLADGTWLTPDIAAGIAEDVRRAAGRPSLTGPGRHSPQVSARVPAELRDAAEQQARREGKSVSQLIRELLERYLSGSPDGVRHCPGRHGPAVPGSPRSTMRWSSGTMTWPT